jgi:hypothetical protein
MEKRRSKLVIQTVRNSSIQKLAKFKGVPQSDGWPEAGNESAGDRITDVISEKLIERLHRTSDSVKLRRLDSALPGQSGLAVEVSGAALTGSPGAILRLVNTGNSLDATLVSGDGKETSLPPEERPALVADSSSCMDVVHLPNGDRVFVTGLNGRGVGIKRTSGADSLAFHYNFDGDLAELDFMAVGNRTDSDTTEAYLTSSGGVHRPEFMKKEHLPGDMFLTRTLREDGRRDTRLMGRFEDVSHYRYNENKISTSGAINLQEDSETFRSVMNEATTKFETENGLLLSSHSGQPTWLR